MNKSNIKKLTTSKKILSPQKRRSSGKSSMAPIPKDSPLWADDEDDGAEEISVPSEIQVISPIYFKNHRGEVFEQARDGAIFVVKRRNEHMAIICGYNTDTLAKITGLDKRDAELDEDPMQQRVSIAELLELIKNR